MWRRIAGTVLATTAIALLATGALSPWWDGHPREQGSVIQSKQARVGLLGGEGCFTKGTGRCQTWTHFERVDDLGFAAAGAAAFAGGLGGAVILLSMTGLVLLRPAGRRGRLAWIGAGLFAIAGAGAAGFMSLLPMRIDLPIADGGMLFLAGVGGGLLAALVLGWGRRPHRVPTSVSAPASMRVDALALLEAGGSTGGKRAKRRSDPAIGPSGEARKKSGRPAAPPTAVIPRGPRAPAAAPARAPEPRRSPPRQSDPPRASFDGPSFDAGPPPSFEPPSARSSFEPPDAFAARSSFEPPDAFAARSSFEPPDAFATRSSFEPPEAFVAPEPFAPPPSTRAHGSPMPTRAPPSASSAPPFVPPAAAAALPPPILPGAARSAPPSGVSPPRPAPLTSPPPRSAPPTAPPPRSAPPSEVSPPRPPPPTLPPRVPLPPPSSPQRAPLAGPPLPLAPPDRLELPPRPPRPMFDLPTPPPSAFEPQAGRDEMTPTPEPSIRDVTAPDGPDRMALDGRDTSPEGRGRVESEPPDVTAPEGPGGFDRRGSTMSEPTDPESSLFADDGPLLPRTPAALPPSVSAAFAILQRQSPEATRPPPVRPALPLVAPAIPPPLAAPLPAPRSGRSTGPAAIPSTAPVNLPAPDLEAPSSGPVPACPHCESPTRWIDEHLRFYCPTCRLYL